MKYIFLDLDNTLICADLLTGNQPKNSKLFTYENGRWSEKYYARMRGGALDLLANLRKLGKVYMLTAAATDYARAWNKEFDFGFDEKDIYTREDTEIGKLTLSEKFPEKGECYLIDDKDLPFNNTVIKVNFLKEISTKVEIIVVKPFYGNANQALDEKKIDSILNQIK